MKDRIRQLRKEKGLTQQMFAEKIGTKRGNIASYETGKNTPSDAIISLICKTFNVNEEWLRTGNGDMFNDITQDEEITSFIGHMLSKTDNTFQKKILHILARLEPSEWEALANIANKLVKEIQENKNLTTDE